jgi:hypothetical protein
MNIPICPPTLTRVRVVTAFALALAADGAQLAVGPLGWAFIDQGIDLAAMIAMSWLIGFHPLFLPTFVIELVPVADMLPTWTGCVAAVVFLRKRQNGKTAPPPARNQPTDVIDV